MNPFTLRTCSTLFLLSFVVTALNGCFLIFDGDDDDDIILNSDPEIIASETFWVCDLNEQVGDYYFEFQAVVDDLDGVDDVEFVDVTVFDSDFGGVVDTFSLIPEGGGVWGGLVWELESNLFEWCGLPIDVQFEAWDFHNGYDSLTLYYD
ncbi:MAG: hypothetical protein VX498_13330 [Myxococcota bacterium]|nr:hypothetical protein [Myxococcota bacterium]